MEAVGLFDYQKLLEAADAITDDLNARYAAYAKADAWLIENAFALSVQCTAEAKEAWLAERAKSAKSASK